MVTKRLYLQIGAQKKARFFSLMYFCESLCINRISHNYVIPQFLFCIIMPFRTSFHISFRKLFPPLTLTGLGILQFKPKRRFFIRQCFFFSFTAHCCFMAILKTSADINAGQRRSLTHCIKNLHRLKK